MKILVVDDERIRPESLRKGLRSKGRQVVEASDSCTALNPLTTSD